MYLEKLLSQLTEGKCLRCASFLSRPQNTCTMPRVAEVTGSEKSPPGGETLQEKNGGLSVNIIIYLLSGRGAAVMFFKTALI